MVNMGLKNLGYKVKVQQEKVNEKLDSFAKFQEEWVENADRWVTGFLENFEEGCHSMGTKIREKITGSMGQSGNFMLIQYNREHGAIRKRERDKTIVERDGRIEFRHGEVASVETTRPV